jgi:hypothetical protein
MGVEIVIVWESVLSTKIPTLVPPVVTPLIVRLPLVEEIVVFCPRVSVIKICPTDESVVSVG